MFWILSGGMISCSIAEPLLRYPLAIPDEALNKARRRAQVQRWNLNGKPKYCIFELPTRVMPNYKLQQEVDLLKRKVDELEKPTKAQAKLLEQYSK